MLLDIIFPHILSVSLSILHEWLTGLQEDKVVSAVFLFTSITMPVTFKTTHPKGFRQYVCARVCVYVAEFLSGHVPIMITSGTSCISSIVTVVV